jgi:uncharacterized protein YgiM (DUF1202 family)
VLVYISVRPKERPKNKNTFIKKKIKNQEEIRYKKEKKTMTDMMNMAINDMDLDNVTGGATRTVKNNSLKYANIREGAGLKSKVITKLNNGTKVKTTGNKIRKDGYVWYEITLENGSDNAWIAGSLIGY